MLSITEQIRIITRRQGLTLTELAAATGQSRQNLNNKLMRDNWSIKDLQAIATAAGVNIKILWTDKDGQSIF